MYPSGPPAGWYPDPGGSGGWRWWDGGAWTPHLAAPSGPPRPAVPGLVAAELRMVPWALASAAVLGVVSAASIAVFIASVPQLRAFGRWYHQVLSHIGQPGYVAPPPPTLTAVGGGFLGFDGLAIIQIAAIVVFLVWQYRAARAAQSAGYPATHSPGWGVGCWFVPIVNLWMPFQALRDCLAPGTPHRRRIWLVLALGVAGIALNEAGLFTALFASSGATPLLVVGGLLELGAFATMLDVVRRTSAAHRELIQ